MVPLRVETWLAVFHELGGYPAEHIVSITLHRRFQEHPTLIFVL